MLVKLFIFEFFLINLIKKTFQLHVNLNPFLRHPKEEVIKGKSNCYIRKNRVFY